MLTRQTFVLWVHLKFGAFQKDSPQDSLPVCTSWHFVAENEDVFSVPLLRVVTLVTTLQTLRCCVTRGPKYQAMFWPVWNVFTCLSTRHGTQYSENHISAVRTTFVLYSVNSERTFRPFLSDHIRVQASKNNTETYLHIFYYVVEVNSDLAFLLHCQCLRLHKIVQMYVSS